MNDKEHRLIVHKIFPETENVFGFETAALLFVFCRNCWNLLRADAHLFDMFYKFRSQKCAPAKIENKNGFALGAERKSDVYTAVYG